MTDEALDWLGPALEALDRADLHRALRHHDSPAAPWIELEDGRGRRHVLHLCSNSYLGLATHPEVVTAAVEAVTRYGTSSGASRLVTGGQTPHRTFERDLAAWKGTGDAALLSSGYLANLAVLTALADRGDTIVSDELNHASIVDACRLSKAEVRIYRHADPEHAAALLRDAPGRRVLVTDGVFSMDGDLAPLPELCDVAEQHRAAVVVDDAHGTGLLGPEGQGTVAALGCDDRVDAIVGTLSKALASVGGYVAGSAPLVDWIRNRARPFVFDTALPPSAVAAAAAALRVTRGEPERRARALDLARRLADGIRATGREVVEPAACIVPVVVGSNGDALAAMDRLLAGDVLAVAIRPPSVAPGTARIRATVMATHSDADVTHAVAAFTDALRRAA
ncbi:MAG: 8-amino-7-oxononanoate synthase [Actinobacteria bacterium]|nr:8-amino-7-oxononanoate synthase [Actinomycetota bacterium]